MKKSILRSLRENDSAAFGESMGIKALKKAVCAQYTDIEDKKERKLKFQESLSKLESRGKVLVENSTVKLTGKRQISDDSDADVAVVPERSVRAKKQKLEPSDTSLSNERDDDETRQKKKSNHKLCDESIPAIPPVAAVATIVVPALDIEEVKKTYPPVEAQVGNNTILLFYAYCVPVMSRADQDKAIAFCYKILSTNGVTGRLRVAREGFNSTLTGPHDKMRLFTSALKKMDPSTFSKVDFKYVDGQPDNQLLKGLKVWPVTEIVTYGFNPLDAPLEMGGTHLTPQEFHDSMAEENSIVVDVRNFNETAIGRFQPPGALNMESKVLDPKMRRSTEFPGWVEENRHLLQGKKVLMYCTAGVRCERASAFMRNKGIENVFQLEGGVHRYLDTFPEDGGYWVGKNYTFDKRFSHGAKESVCVSQCVFCTLPWDRYQAQKTCCKCGMEVILCRECQKTKPPPPKEKLICPLCSSSKNPSTDHKKYTARNVLL